MLTSSLLGWVVCCVEDPTPRVNRSRSVRPNVMNEEEEIHKKKRAVPDSESPQMLHISRPTTRTNMKLSSFLQFFWFTLVSLFFQTFFIFLSIFPHTRRRRRRQPNVIISYFYFAHKRGCDCRNTSQHTPIVRRNLLLFFFFVCVKPPTTF